MNLLLPIILMVVFSSLLGSLWFSDALFGKLWRKGLDVTEADMVNMKKSAAKALSGNLVMTVIAMTVMAWMFRNYQLLLTSPSGLMAGVRGLMTAASPWNGIAFGFLIWLGFVMPTVMQGFFFERKPWIVTRINLGFRLVELLGTGLILTLFW